MSFYSELGDFSLFGLPPNKAEAATQREEPKSPEKLSDIDWKIRGNDRFIRGKFKEAITCYSTAIIKNPTNHNFFTNRALSYMRLKQFDSARPDLRRALELHPDLAKGHFLLGRCLIELKRENEGIRHLQKAQDLDKKQKLNYKDDIESELESARKKQKKTLEEKETFNEIELQIYLNRLIRKDAERKLLKAEMKSAIEAAMETSMIEEQTEAYRRKLNEMFEKSYEALEKRETPDVLCCGISFELLQNPVITPSGITYERKNIEEHLKRVGLFDPATRTPLTTKQLIPNLAMREIIEVYVKDNPWALDQ